MEECWIRKLVTQTQGESQQLLPWLLPFRAPAPPCSKGQVPLLDVPMEEMVSSREFNPWHSSREVQPPIFQSEISTKAPEPPTGCSIKNISIRASGGKNYPEEVTEPQMCPEGLERRRKSSSPREERLSIQPSWKWGDPGPILQRFVFVLPWLYSPQGQLGNFLLSCYHFANPTSA